ncbi:hypothetical protein CICLE_v10030172mg [Citrus x clementina]|uniref:Uncharacterized protein n=1 Tax=Citrus clementina TaxID=85681 RepID=V4UDH5_CITCL|nr:hypothetical protein CICLE_v10030172mg [Citrus x clementina]
MRFASMLITIRQLMLRFGIHPLLYCHCRSELTSPLAPSELTGLSVDDTDIGYKFSGAAEKEFLTYKKQFTYMNTAASSGAMKLQPHKAYRTRQSGSSAKRNPNLNLNKQYYSFAFADFNYHLLLLSSNRHLVLLHL